MRGRVYEHAQIPGLDGAFERLIQQTSGPAAQLLAAELERAWALSRAVAIHGRRLAERAVRGEHLALHVRWPLAMLRHVLEAEPRPTDLLAEVNVRLCSIRMLQEQSERDWNAYRMRERLMYGMWINRPFSVVNLLTGI